MHLTTARWLLALSVLGITYGSLYPFDVTPTPIGFERGLTILMSNWQDELGLPNIFANIVLFVPFGFFAALAFAGMSALPRWCLVFSSAAALAFGLQVAQLWLDARTPTFADGFINMGGTVLGITLAQIPLLRSAVLQFHVRSDQLIAIPVLLMLSWLAYRWFPYVPTIDVAAIREGLRPLATPEIRPLNLFHNLVAWLVFASLWKHCQFKEYWLWLVIPGAVLLQTFIADNPLTLHNLLAAGLAPPLWYALGKLFARPVEPVILLLIVMLVVQGLRPFQLAPSSFEWLPFTGFLTGNMMINLMSLLEKLFLYGSLVWLTLEASQSRATGLWVPVLVVGAIETAQTQIVGRVAEITDPLLCLVIWSIALLGWRPMRERRRTPVRQPAHE